jgi:hypothetical protein
MRRRENQIDVWGRERYEAGLQAGRVECDRLRAINADLVAVLKRIIEVRSERDKVLMVAEAAIAKAKGKA